VPARVEIKGTRDFRVVAARLRAAGDGRLRREMARRMRTAAQPAVTAAQREVLGLSNQASRGGGGQARAAHTLSRARRVTERTKARAYAGRGLRATVARATRVQVALGGRSAGVRIRTQTRHLPPDQRRLPRHLDRGQWRHPVFGNRDAWVTQTASPPGWFTTTMRRHGPRIRARAGEAVDAIAQQIAR